MECLQARPQWIRTVLQRWWSEPLVQPVVECLKLVYVAHGIAWPSHLNRTICPLAWMKHANQSTKPPHWMEHWGKFVFFFSFIFPRTFHTKSSISRVFQSVWFLSQSNDQLLSSISAVTDNYPPPLVQFCFSSLWFIITFFKLLEFYLHTICLNAARYVNSNHWQLLNL